MESVTSLFTFGYSQFCPYTGKDLGDHYALVTAPDKSSARTFMNTAFKQNYAFEYDGPTDPNIADYVPRMTLHLTVNLVPEQPMPPGFEYVRDAADPIGMHYSRPADDPQPAAGRVPAHLEDARTGEVVMVDPTPVGVVHLALDGDTACELQVADLPKTDRHSADHAHVTCTECLEAVPF